MKKKLLTLDNLYTYFESRNEDVLFSSKKENVAIIVQVDEILTFASDYDSSDGLLKTHLKSCHILENRNHSNITKETMEEAIPSFYNRPILGFIHQLSDGSYDFAGHEMIINEDSIEYEEVPVGVIPESCNAQLVYDEKEDKTYLEVDGYIYEGYSKAADILRDKGGSSKVSVELSIDELSYSAKDKVLNIDKFHFNGVTILGKDRETEKPIEEGMKGANITISDFSSEKNSFFSEQYTDLINKLQEIEKKIEDFSNKEGGIEPVKFDELLKKYGKTAEDVTFEYEGLSDEELEAKFEQMFSEKPVDNSIKKCSIEAEGKTYTFEVSMDEKIRALESVVNTTYSESDNAYYYVKAYDNYVVMIDYWTGKAFKQSYKVEDDNFNLTGDREAVYANYLTRAEETALDEMRANYSSIESKLQEYESKELESKKASIIADEAYDAVRESEEFTELSNNLDKYSVEEVESKCDEMLKQFVRENKNFSMNDEKKKKVRVGAKKEETYSPYGKLFAEIK